MWKMEILIVYIIVYIVVYLYIYVGYVWFVDCNVRV